MKGDEARVESAFADWLAAQGWNVRRQVEYIDIVATRNGEEMRVEVKGEAGADAGTAADTMYGQLLRHMVDRPGVMYAVVGPSTGIQKILRVPTFVRERLQIRVFEVTAAGAVIDASSRG